MAPTVIVSARAAAASSRMLRSWPPASSARIRPVTESAGVVLGGGSAFGDGAAFGALRGVGGPGEERLRRGELRPLRLDRAAEILPLPGELLLQVADLLDELAEGVVAGDGPSCAGASEVGGGRRVVLDLGVRHRRLRGWGRR